MFYLYINIYLVLIDLNSFIGSVQLYLYIKFRKRYIINSKE